MRAALVAAPYVLGALAAGIASYGFALAGEPRSVWLMQALGIL